MIISYDYYRIFYYVAKYQSFTKAAAMLMNNQPNITRSVKNLESELGCTLFTRSSRNVRLTPEGEKLFEHVSVAVERITQGEQELFHDKSLHGGIVTVAASEIALHELLLPVLNSFHCAYPDIKIRISNHSTPQAMAAVKNGLADIAVVTTPTGTAKPLSEKKIKPFSETAVCSKAFEKLRGKKLHLRDLQEYPLICLDKSTKTYEFYNKLFLSHNLEFTPDIEVATADQILPVVTHNLGIGFVPEAIAKSALESGEIFRLELADKIPQRFICTVKRTDRSLSIAAKEFEKFVNGGAAD